MVADNDGDGFDDASDNCDASGDAVVARGGAGNSFVCAFGGIVDGVLISLEVFLSELLEVEGQRGGGDGDARRHSPTFLLLSGYQILNTEFFPLS